jgi:hypothetical protein
MRPLPKNAARLLRRPRLNGFYKRAGCEDMANFVSKRLQRVAAAVLCLMAVQSAVTVTSSQRAMPAGAFAISR